MIGEDYSLCYAMLRDVHFFTISKRKYKREKKYYTPVMM